MIGKYYIVFEERKLGIYNTWNKAKLQVLVIVVPSTGCIKIKGMQKMHL